MVAIVCSSIELQAIRQVLVGVSTFVFQRQWVAEADWFQKIYRKECCLVGLYHVACSDFFHVFARRILSSQAWASSVSCSDERLHF